MIPRTCRLIGRSVTKARRSSIGLRDKTVPSCQRDFVAAASYSSHTIEYSRPACAASRRHFSSGPASKGGSNGPAASDAALLKQGIRDLADCLGKGEGAADWHKAMTILDDMSKNGVRPDISCYNVALAACVRADKLEQAMELLETLGGRGLQPNCLSYNIIILGCGRLGDWRRGMQLLDGMDSSSVKPDASSFHGVMMACGRAKEANLVTDLLKEMEAKGVGATAVTYSTAIAALARCGEWGKALELLKSMSAKGVQPSMACYHAAMFACGKPDPGRWIEAVDLLRDLKARGIPLTVESYNEAIFACGKAGELEMAEKLLREMTSEHGLLPNNMSYRGVIKALQKKPDYEKCLAVLEEMESKKLEPDVLVFTDVLEVFAKSTNPGATLRVLDNIKKAKPPDLRLYVGSMIRADELCEAAVHESLLAELHNAMVVVDQEVKKES